MDILNEDLNREISRIKDKLESANSLNEHDLKILLLSLLSEEDNSEN